MFHSDTDPIPPLYIRPSAITQSLLFDLAPFKSEAGASPLFTLQSDTVNIRECVCVSVFLAACVCGCLSVCVKQECQEDAWILGSGLCGKISQEASPLSSILQGEKEREKARGYFTSQFTETQRLCVQHCSLKAWQLINIPLVAFKMNRYDSLPQITVKKKR